MDRVAIKKEAKDILKENWLKLVAIFAIYSLISVVCNFIGEFSSSLGSILKLVFVIFSIPLSYGVIISFIKTYKKEQVKYLDFITDGFKNFKIAWGICFKKILKLLPRILICLFIAILIAIPVSNLIYNSMTEYKEQGLIDELYTEEISEIIDLSNFEELIVIYSSAILGVMLFLVTFLVLLLILVFPKSLYYSLTEYIKYEEGNEITTKEAIEKSKKIMTKNRGKWFVLGLSFIGWLLLVSFGVGFVLGFINGIFGVEENMLLSYAEEIVSTVAISFVTVYMQMSYLVAYKKLSEKNNIEEKVEEA